MLAPVSTPAVDARSLPPASPRPLAFAALAALSLVLDRGVAVVGEALSMPSWPARLFLPSLAVALAVYVATGPGDSFCLPSRTGDGEPVSLRARVVIVAIWLGVVAESVGLTLLTPAARRSSSTPWASP